VLEKNPQVISFRVATVEDIPAILEMCHALVDETNEHNTFVNIPLHEGKTRTMLHRYITQPGMYFTGIAEIDGEIVGALFGHIVEYYFCHYKLAQDIAWYVKPEFRGTFAGVVLLKEFERWSSDHGASEVCIAIATGIYAERTGKLLEKRGFGHVGGIYKLRLE